MGKKTQVVTQGAKLAVKYGPLVKVAWDKGGKQATTAAAKRALTMNSRRRALAHASGVIDGSMLKIAPEGTTIYVVFTGDQPIAVVPASAGAPDRAAPARRPRPAGAGRRAVADAGPAGPGARVGSALDAAGGG